MKSRQERIGAGPRNLTAQLTTVSPSPVPPCGSVADTPASAGRKRRLRGAPGANRLGARPWMYRPSPARSATATALAGGSSGSGRRVRRRGCCTCLPWRCCGGVLRRRSHRPRAGLPQRRGGGAVAARRARPRRAVPLRRPPVARDRDRRSAARRLLDAARDGARPDGREHRRGRGRRAAPAPPHGWAWRAGSGRRRARPCRLRAGRGGGQCRVRAVVVAAGRRDLGRRARAGVSHLDAWRRRRRPGGRAGDPHVGDRGVCGPSTGASSWRARSCSPCWWRWRSCRHSAMCPTSSSRSCCGRRSASGRAEPPRPSSSSARSRSGTRRRTMGRSCATRSPTACSRRSSSSPSRRSHRWCSRRRPPSAPGRARRSRRARRPSARWRTSRRRCAGWPRSSRAGRRRAACSGR